MLLSFLSQNPLTCLSYKETVLMVDMNHHLYWCFLRENKLWILNQIAKKKSDITVLVPAVIPVRRKLLIHPLAGISAWNWGNHSSVPGQQCPTLLLSLPRPSRPLSLCAGQHALQEQRRHCPSEPSSVSMVGTCIRKMLSICGHILFSTSKLHWEITSLYFY